MASIGFRVVAAMGLVCAHGAGVFSAAPAIATTFVPIATADLARSSAAVVVGTVRDVVPVMSASGGIARRVAIDVESVLTGTAPSALVLEEPGGRMGGITEVVFGSPAYAAGERVLVFVASPAARAQNNRAQDPHLHTNQLALGKFAVVGDLAIRSLGPGTTLAGGDPTFRTAVPLAELIAEIEDGVGAPRGSIEVPRPSSSDEGGGGFTLFDPAARFFEADVGRPLSFLIDIRGDDILGIDPARDALNDAFAAWTDVEDASIEIDSAGLIGDLTTPCTPGFHKIRFNDPDDEIDDPVNCSGVLGVGGFCSTDGELKRFNGTTFQKAVRALVTFADGWEGCATWNVCNVAEVATHEVGHAIGFDHSSEDLGETDATLLDATMYFRTHFDGRCGGVRNDDVAAVTFVYPVDAPPSITSAPILPPGVAGEPYEVTLAATRGAGSFNWEDVGGICQGFPGLEVTASGVIRGSPTAFGSGCFSIRVTDANGDSHTRRFDIEVRLTPATPTNTSQPATPTPTLPSATPTRTPTLPPVEDCTGDCSGDGVVSLDELIRAVNAALGIDPDACPEADRDGDGTITIDELVAAVRAAASGCL